MPLRYTNEEQMPAFPIRERLIPYRVLFYFLYAVPGDVEWLESIGDNQVRVTTGDAARDLRLKNTNLWKAIYWLKGQGLILDWDKEEKRGTVIITLRQPTNIKLEGKN